MIKKDSFIFSDAPEPHRIRTKEILKKHPDIRKLIGKNPNTIFVIIGLVALQIVMSWLVADKSW